MERRRPLNEAVSGLFLAAYLVGVPVLVAKLWPAVSLQRGRVIHALLIGLLALWCYVLGRLLVTTIALRREHERRGGYAWLAGALLSLASFLIPNVASATTTHSSAHHHVATPLSAVPALPLALMAKRRRDELTQWRLLRGDDMVDDAIEEMRHRDNGFIHALRALIPEAPHGVVTIANDASLEEPVALTTPTVVVPLECHDGLWTVAFARPGARLLTHGSNNPRVIENAVALHDGGHVIVSYSLVDTLTHLLTRAHPGIVVIHASNEHLDEAIAMLCVSVAGERSTLDEPRSSIRVALLRADVTIDGLSAPFNADLRRRCVEMTAYLALHRHQAVSGDRLRIRVLGGPDTDASLRTLSNTASAIRKSLGVSGDQTRLLPVGPSGHYRVIDVSTDVEECHRLIAEAKSEASDRQVALLRDALALIEGEPLTAESRGYEWFVAEGHMARLIRDVEWAVTQLIEYAKSAHDQDLAWWARDKGRLVDPWNPRFAVPSRRDEY